MKVEGNPISPISSGKPEGVSSGDKAAKSTKTSSASSGKDVASLSEQARLLAKSRIALESIPEVRAELVSRLKQEILSGTYTVQVDQLADVLLRSLNLKSP